MTNTSSRHNRGFTLIEMAIVLLIIGLALGMILNVTGSMRDTQNRQLVQTKLAVLDTALANFVAQNKRLPCPANGTLASTAVGVGVETLSAGPPPAANPPKGTCGPANQTNGVIPWVTLGLTESDATDPWNGRMTYRVFPPLAMQAQSVGASPLTPIAAPYGLMDMTACDPAGTSNAPVAIAGACGGFNSATGCTQCAPSSACSTATLNQCVSPANYLKNKGLDVWDGVNGATGWAIRQNNPALGTGAAYVIISHGPSGTGAYNSSGILQPGSVAAGADELPNRANLGIALPSAQGTTYRDAKLNENPAAHFDDYLSHPTIMSVLNKANLGPRAH